jgi:hypothetical protein
MALMSDYGGDFELPPEGRHVAALVRFVDLGAQPGKFGVSRNAELAFEIEGEKTADGRPMLAFKRIFNLSNRSKNFREVVRALSNTHDISGVNTSDLLGKWCEIVIEHVHRGRLRVREPGVPATQGKGAVNPSGIGIGFL